MRWVPFIAIHLALGAVISFAVAWALAAWAPLADRGTLSPAWTLCPRPSETSEAGRLLVIPEGGEALTVRYEMQGPGLRWSETLYAVRGTAAWDRMVPEERVASAPTSADAQAQEVSLCAGWPWTACGASASRRYGPDVTGLPRALTQPSIPLHPTRRPWPPAAVRAFTPSRCLPLVPRWGLLPDAALFGLASASFVAGARWIVGGVRRQVRRWRRRCPACGYELAGVTKGICPECGAAADSPGDRSFTGTPPRMTAGNTRSPAR